jgi:Spy/CpxP family protein refolding chaperone
MRTSRKLALASVVLPLTASVLLAQNPAPPAQNSNPATGTRGGQGQSSFPSPLYRQDDVARSLNLTADQLSRLNRATDDLQSRYRSDFDRLGSLSDRERAARSADLMRRYGTDWSKATSDIFNDQQRSRYGQLDLQYRGIGAFSDPELQRRMNLTDQQIAQMRDLDTWSLERMREFPERMRTSQDRGAQAWSDYRRQGQERLNKILTPEQQRAWSQITGEPYNFRPPVTGTSSSGTGTGNDRGKK